MNNITIKQMDISDFNKIKQNLLSDFDDFWSINTFESELKSQNSYYIIAEINDEIVGFAGLKYVLDNADIMNIVTKKNKRNLGIGYMLLENLIIFCNKNSINQLTLEVNEQNLPAIHLYKKFNFKKISTRNHYYQNGDTAIIMQLDL